MPRFSEGEGRRKRNKKQTQKETTRNEDDMSFEDSPKTNPKNNNQPEAKKSTSTSKAKSTSTSKAKSTSTSKAKKTPTTKRKNANEKLAVKYDDPDLRLSNLSLLDIKTSQLDELTDWIKNNCYTSISENEFQFLNGSIFKLDDYADTFATKKRTYSRSFSFKKEDVVCSEKKQQGMIASGLFGDIFQKLDGKKNDRKRLHLLGDDLKYHPKYKNVKATLDNIKSAVLEKVEGMVGKKKGIRVNISVLYSKPGCEEQDCHIDDPRYYVGSTTILSALVGIQQGTRLNLSKSSSTRAKKVEKNIHQGSAIIIDASKTIHGGCSYDNSNIRLHMYITFDKKTDEEIKVGENLYEISCPFCETGNGPKLEKPDGTLYDEKRIVKKFQSNTKGNELYYRHIRDFHPDGYDKVNRASGKVERVVKACAKEYWSNSRTITAQSVVDKCKGN